MRPGSNAVGAAMSICRDHRDHCAHDALPEVPAGQGGHGGHSELALCCPQDTSIVELSGWHVDERALTLVSALEARGIALMADGDGFVARPSSRLTPEDVEALRRQRQAVLKVVRVVEWIERGPAGDRR